MTQIDFNAALPHKPAKNRSKPIKTNPFDMAPVKTSFAPYRKAIDEMLAQAQAHEVTDDVTLKAAVAMAGQAQSLDKKIETQRKAIVEEPNRFVKSVNGFAKDFQVRLRGIVKDLKKKIADYQYAQEMARREAERKAQEEARKLQEKLNAEAAEKGIEAPVVTTPVLPEPEKVTRTDTGAAAHIRKEWTFKIVDPAAVPREYCVPDEKLIRQAVKMGVREIPGIEIWEEAKTVLRTA